jgi:hypothetical protein
VVAGLEVNLKICVTNLFAAALLFAVIPGRAAPAIDNFANAILISGTSNTVTGSNVDASIEMGEPDPYHQA